MCAHAISKACECGHVSHVLYCCKLEDFIMCACLC